MSIECYQSRNLVDIQAVVMMDFTLWRLLEFSRNWSDSVGDLCHFLFWDCLMRLHALRLSAAQIALLIVYSLRRPWTSAISWCGTDWDLARSHVENGTFTNLWVLINLLLLVIIGFPFVHAPWDGLMSWSMKFDVGPMFTFPMMKHFPIPDINNSDSYLCFHWRSYHCDLLVLLVRCHRIERHSPNSLPKMVNSLG